MINRLMILGFLLFFVNPAIGFDHLHNNWGWVLDLYQEPDGRLHYGRLQRDIKAGKAPKFADYLSGLQAVGDAEYSNWKESEKLSFLINAYNAFTVKLVSNEYPVKSIRKIGGLFSNPWKKEFFSLLGGKIKTLDAIEHEYLRKQFQAPEVHAAINCASFSCPRLQHTPFVPQRVMEQLDAAFREFLSDLSRNRYEPSTGKLFLSEIFKWFGGDFESKYGGYLKAIERLGPPAAKQAIKAGGKVEWISYDWSLNDADPAK